MAKRTRNTESNSTDGKGERWYENDVTTVAVAPAAKPVKREPTAEVQAEIALIKESALPAATKANAIAALLKPFEPQADPNAKPLTLTIARAQKTGSCDLISVNGGFRGKMLSPRLLREILDNADFVRAYLDKYAQTAE